VLGEIDLVRALGAAKIPCAVAAVPGDPATYSRHAQDMVEWFDPWDESDRMLSSLLDWGRKQDDKPVLYYNGDHDLLLVSRHRERLAEHFRFVIGERELVEDLVDKERFRDLAVKLDLPVPVNVSFDAASSSESEPDVPYPAVLKPATRRDDIWAPVSGGKKAVRVDDAAELRELWPSLLGQGRMIAQSLIEGDESRIESYHVFADESGKILCEFTGRKIRTLPALFGDTTSLEITEESDVAELGRDLVARMNLTGVAKFDFKRDDDGRLWLLEINPRFNLWHNAGAVAGANIPAAVYRHLTDGTAWSCKARPGVTWCHPTKDAKAARAAGIGTTSWMRWVAGTDAKWGMSARDPMPFVRGVLIRRLKKKLGRG
jgi:predicted ATP-grasp superfamily ATP-dependent carboligase